MAEGKPKMQVVGRVDTTKEAGPPRWDPSKADPLIAQAVTALQAGDLPAAESAFTAAHEASRHDPRPLGGLALIALQRGELKQAVAFGKDAAARRDVGWEALHNLGWALEQTGDKPGAIAAYLDSFRADPSRPEPIHQLVRHGRVPTLAGQEEQGEPQSLDTLARLELYDSVGRAVHHEGSDGSFRHTVDWAIDRGAPWGQIAAWLAGQGIVDDGSLIATLSPRDLWLADTWISGFIVAPGVALKRAAATTEDLQLLVDGGSARKDALLFARLDHGDTRALIPPQRSSAAHVVGLAQQLFPILGADSALLLLVDPALHLGPRRLFIVTPSSDCEIVGTWKGAMADGSDAPLQALPDATPVPADAVPLYVPGTDAESLAALIREHLLDDVVRVGDVPGMALVTADRVGDFRAAWLAFLARVAAQVPPGNATVARWREGNRDLLAILRPDRAPDLVTLRSVWPHDEGSADLPVPIEHQFLGRALFQAPRPKG